MAPRQGISLAELATRRLHDWRRAGACRVAAPDRVALEVPVDLEGGAMEVKAPWLPSPTPFVHVGVLVATGFHQVDNPAIDREGRVYVT